MSTIKSIREFKNWSPTPDGWDTYDGYMIVTDEQTFIFGIDNSQSCCESWGYLLSEQDTRKFIGAELLGVRKTDTDRQTEIIEYTHPEQGKWDCDSGGVVFMDILTSEGILQFAAYNSHNGYYGHTVNTWIYQKPETELYV